MVTLSMVSNQIIRQGDVLNTAMLDALNVEHDRKITEELALRTVSNFCLLDRKAVSLRPGYGVVVYSTTHGYAIIFRDANGDYYRYITANVGKLLELPDPGTCCLN